MKIILPFLFALFLLGCNQPVKQHHKQQPVGEAVSYAKHFSITHRGEYTELVILNPENGSVEQRYGLVKKTFKGKLPEGFIPIEVPLKSVIALSGTHIGMMNKLECLNAIEGISSAKYVHNVTVLKNFKAGKVLEFDDLGMLNPERVLKTSAKLIMYSGFEGRPPSNADKLAKLGILCMPNYDWKEFHPLGKAEWIKLFGVLFEKEAEANAYFEDTRDRYNELCAQVKNFKEHPTVFSGMMFGDIWYMPAGESFGARFFKDAGADYVAKDEKGTGSVALSFENVLKKNQQTDFWLNVDYDSKKAILTANAKYKYFGAFQKDKVYSFAHDMNNYWENAAIEPQLVLSDLIQIFHEGKLGAVPLQFYRKVGK